VAVTPPRLVSSRFPYVPIRVEVRQRTGDFEALLDTGFDDDVVVPASWSGNGQPPDGHVRLELGDGSLVVAPYYDGTAGLAGLGSFPVLVIALGDEPIVGRGLTDRFRVTLDHGQRVIVEP
jgi:predicted aspartyl protease